MNLLFNQIWHNMKFGSQSYHLQTLKIQIICNNSPSRSVQKSGSKWDRNRLFINSCVLHICFELGCPKTSCKKNTYRATFGANNFSFFNLESCIVCLEEKGACTLIKRVRSHSFKLRPTSIGLIVPNKAEAYYQLYFLAQKKLLPYIF